MEGMNLDMNMSADINNGMPQYGPNTMGTNARREQMYNMCKKHMYYYTQIEGQDGSQYEGIIHGVDDDHVDLLMPAGHMDNQEDQRQFWGYGGYPYGGFNRIPFRFRRFRRFRFPFFRIRRFFFPFFY